MRSALALLGEASSGGGLTLACPAPGGGGVTASFRLDGGATLRVTGTEAVPASGALDALWRLEGRLAAARDALAGLRAALDVAVGAVSLAAAVLAAAAGGPGWDALLRFALVSAAYAALIPCRRALMRRVLGALARAALRRAEE